MVLTININIFKTILTLSRTENVNIISQKQTKSEQRGAINLSK